MVMALVGILLFITGFVVTLAAVGNSRAVSATNSDSSERNHASSEVVADASLIIGILVSLAGVVLATVGPAMGVLKGGG